MDQFDSIGDCASRQQIDKCLNFTAAAYFRFKLQAKIANTFFQIHHNNNKLCDLAVWW